jgi:hypothetical protein
MFCPGSSFSVLWQLSQLLQFTLLNHLQPTKSIYIEPVQGLNLNRRSISGLEPKMPVTKGSGTAICQLHESRDGAISFSFSKLRKMKIKAQLSRISSATYKLEGQAELSAFLIEFYRVSHTIETRILIVSACALQSSGNSCTTWGICYHACVNIEVSMKSVIIERWSWFTIWKT